MVIIIFAVVMNHLDDGTPGPQNVAEKLNIAIQLSEGAARMAQANSFPQTTKPAILMLEF